MKTAAVADREWRCTYCDRTTQWGDEARNWLRVSRPSLVGEHERHVWEQLGTFCRDDCLLAWVARVVKHRRSERAAAAALPAVNASPLTVAAALGRGKVRREG